MTKTTATEASWTFLTMMVKKLRKWSPTAALPRRVTLQPPSASPLCCRSGVAATKVLSFSRRWQQKGKRRIEEIQQTVREELLYRGPHPHLPAADSGGCVLGLPDHLRCSGEAEKPCYVCHLPGSGLLSTPRSVRRAQPKIRALLAPTGSTDAISYLHRNRSVSRQRAAVGMQSLLRQWHPPVGGPG